MNNESAIGIFDSGLGGLTVYEAIRQQLPDENIIYFGDTARVPYGNKSESTVTEYSRQIIDFLLERDVKAVVTACNTASAFALPRLYGVYDIPVLGVIGPGAKAACKQTKIKRVGVIGTEGTVKSQSYSHEIRKLDPEIKTFSQACPLFVPLVEEAWLDNDVALRTAEIYLTSLKQEEVDVLILACTHYPLLKNVIQKVMGGKVTLVDSALETALALKTLLTARDLENKNKTKGTVTFFSSDAPEKFQEHGSRFIQEQISHVELKHLV